MAMKRTFVCTGTDDVPEGCGRTILYKKPGPIPTVCDDCRREAGAPRTDVDRLDNQRRADVRRQQERGVKSHRLAESELKAAKLASAMQMEPNDLESAARLAGINPEEEDMLSLGARAKSMFRDAIENPDAFTSRIISMTAAQLAINALITAPLQSPRDIPGALRQLADFNERMFGGAKQVFSNVVIGDPVVMEDGKKR